MGKQLCIIHANCQGDALAPLLEASEDFKSKFEIRHYVNYKKTELAAEDLKRCGLFLHQYLGPSWGGISTESLLPLLPAQAQTILIPNFFFKGYWPFWTNKITDIEFADSLLESLLQKKLPAEAVLALYLKAPNSLLGDVEAEALASLAKEREKEQFSEIKYVNLLEENWRNRQLFLTVNHPGVELLAHAVRQILQMLGLNSFSAQALQNFRHPQDEFWLPIHPLVGQKLKLPFAAPDRQYNCFGMNLTHKEYIMRYLACREHGIKDLTGVLKGLAEDNSRS